MEYTLKEKLTVTKSFVEDLVEKSWQEIEYLQSQIENLTDTDDGKKLERLLQNLLTSYYIFVGGLENFDNIDYEPVKAAPITEPIVGEPAVEAESEKISYSKDDTMPFTEVSEPFEYLVDFDDPVGEPLTDEDLYN
jgi:hypothetical protein